MSVHSKYFVNKYIYWFTHKKRGIAKPPEVLQSCFSRQNVIIISITLYLWNRCNFLNELANETSVGYVTVSLFLGIKRKIILKFYQYFCNFQIIFPKVPVFIIVHNFLLIIVSITLNFVSFYIGIISNPLKV